MPTRKPSKAGPTRKSTKQTIAITGTGGFLGSMLLRALEADKRFPHILAIDRKPPPFKPKKAKLITLDLMEAGADIKLTKIFSANHCKTIIHAALLSKPVRDIEMAHEFESVGTMQLLTAAEAAKVKKLILSSTTDVYGAFPDNANFLPETHKPRGGSLSPFLKDKIEVEGQFLKFAERHPEKIVTILRIATILGPTVNNFKTHFLQNPLVPTVLGFDPLMQVVHESDVVRAFIKVLSEKHPGIYNIVAKGVLPLSRAIQITGKLPVPVPGFLLYPSAETLWYLNIGSVPGSHINFLKYLCIADGTKMLKKLRFQPVYTSQETLLSFAGRELKREEFTRRLEDMEENS